MSGAWYRDGIRFSCTQCGDCCTGGPGYVWVTRTEVEALAKHRGLDVQAFGRRYLRKVGSRYSLLEKPNGDCIFFEKGCTVYPARPRQCRTFPFWPENLSSRGAWSDVAANCPGAGRGRLYSSSEIDRIRRGEGSASAGL